MSYIEDWARSQGVPYYVTAGYLFMFTDDPSIAYCIALQLERRGFIDVLRCGSDIRAIIPMGETS